MNTILPAVSPSSVENSAPIATPPISMSTSTSGEGLLGESLGQRYLLITEICTDNAVEPNSQQGKHIMVSIDARDVLVKRGGRDAIEGFVDRLLSNSSGQPILDNCRLLLVSTLSERLETGSAEEFEAFSLAVDLESGIHVFAGSTEQLLKTLWDATLAEVRAKYTAARPVEASRRTLLSASGDEEFYNTIIA